MSSFLTSFQKVAFPVFQLIVLASLLACGASCSIYRERGYEEGTVPREARSIPLLREANVDRQQRVDKMG